MAAVDSTTTQIVKRDVEVKVGASGKKQSGKDLQKTRLCVYHLEGKCGYGSDCMFAHSAREVKNAPNLRKTQLCPKFAEGKCANKNCNYAHGEAELREPPNFKKKLCKWYVQGNCRNGTNCGFAHDPKELRVDAPPGFEPIGDQVSPALDPKKLPKVAPPPGLTKMGAENDSASTYAPSSESQAETDLSSVRDPSIPEEHLFRFMAGRGSAPLQQQVTMMNSAIGSLQAKLSQLEDMMLQNQVVQMQQQIAQLSEQCWALESGLGVAQQTAPVAPTPLRSRLSAKAAPFTASRLSAKAPPFTPFGVSEEKSDDSTSVGSE